MSELSLKEKLIPYLFSLPSILLIFVLGTILVFIADGGLRAITWELVTTGVLQDGIFEPIIGTLYMLGGTMVFSVPIGVLTAVYLEEYAPRGRLNRILTQAMNNLAGVPSIVFGLFGYTFFCNFLNFGISLLSGWLTLTCMVLPIIIRGSQEAISMVPESFKQAAEALGATKWQAIKDTVLPTAAPGIATSTILGISRVAGETAAILFTSSVYLMRGLPKTPLEPVMVLTFHIFVLLVTSPSPTLDRVFTMSLILFGLVVLLNIVAYVTRLYYRRRWKW